MAKTNTQPAIPASLEAEKTVLGGILITHGGALDEVIELLAAEDFYFEPHRKIWRAMLGLATTRTPIDLLTLMEAVKSRGELGDIGGAAYLSTLSDDALSAANIGYHARIIRDRSIQRALILVGRHIASEANAGREKPEKLLDAAEAALMAIGRPGGRDFVAIGDLLSDTFRRIELAHSSGLKVPGLSLGLDDLDRIMGGAEPEELIVVGARPSMGKTALLLGALEAVAVNLGKPAALFTLEMSREQIADRLVGMRSGVVLSDMRAGRLAQADFPKVAAGAGELSDKPLYIDDTPAITPMALRAKARRLHRKSPLSMIAVDYVQLMAGDGHSPNEQVSDCSQALKELARELHCPVLLLSQLSREVEKRKPPIPRPSDLRDSGSLEQDADKIIFLYRPSVYSAKARREKPNDAFAIVAKNRNGPTGTCRLNFDGPLVRFRNAEYAGREDGEAPPEDWHDRDREE